MSKILSCNERRKLIKRHRNERDGRIRDRIKAVLAYDDGYSYSEIAKILLLDDETIRRHIEDYLAKDKLQPENGGSESLLDAKKTAELIDHLADNTYLYVKDICTHVKRRFNVAYTVSGMTKWLKSHDFRYKKPHGVPAKANKDQQEAFIKDYSSLKNMAKNEPIYFGDSVHPEHQTRLSYGWILKGERKAIPMTGKQYRLNFIGGIYLNGHKIVYERADKVNTETIKSFLKQLRKKHLNKERIHLIWDNAGYHHSKEVKGYANVLNIKLHYLPPYSPNLNPIERLWKLFHENVTRNRYYEKFTEFTEAAIKFFQNIGKKKKLLQARITDVFQVLHSPIINSS